MHLSLTSHEVAKFLHLKHGHMLFKVVLYYFLSSVKLNCSISGLYIVMPEDGMKVCYLVTLSVDRDYIALVIDE